MKKKMIAVFLGAAFCFSLSACDKVAGTTAKSAESTGFKGEFSLANQDTQGNTSGQKTLAKQQLLTPIIETSIEGKEAFRSYFQQIPADKVNLDVRKQISQDFIAWASNGKPVINAKLFSDGRLNSLKSIMVLPKQYDDWTAPIDGYAQRFIKKNDMAAGRAFMLRYYCFIVFNDAVKPSSGWPSDMSKADFVIQQMREMEFANVFSAEIGHTVPKYFKNPSDIRSDVITALFKLSDDQIYAMFDQANKKAEKLIAEARNGWTVDSVTGRGQSWIVGSRTYNGQMDGWTITDGGQNYFGHGYMAGQLYEVELSSSVEQSHKITRDDKQSQTTGADESVSGQADVK